MSEKGKKQLSREQKDRIREVIRSSGKKNEEVVGLLRAEGIEVNSGIVGYYRRTMNKKSGAKRVPGAKTGGKKKDARGGAAGIDESDLGAVVEDILRLRRELEDCYRAIFLAMRKDLLRQIARARQIQEGLSVEVADARND